VSVKIIAELNPFHTQRTELTVTAKTITDIITELDSGFSLSHARVQRNGEIITDFSLAANDGDTLLIKFVPSGNNNDAGAGMKAGGWALVALGIAALFIPVVGGFLGTALIGAGISTALGGQVMMNLNVPSISSVKDREKPEQDPSIRGGKNQMRQHGRIPVLFGRHRIYPDLAANPHTSIIGGKQYYTQLLCGGYKDYKIDLSSIKLGETSLVELSQTKDINKILAKTDTLIQLEILQNGEFSSLYPNCVHEEALNAVLENQVDDGNGTMISGAITRTTPENTDSINVDIFFYNGLGTYADTGDLVSTSVEVHASYKKTSDPDSAYQSLGFFNNNSNTISGSELKTKRYQITKSGLASDQYTIKIERVTADSSNSRIVDQVYVGSIRSIKSKPPISYERQKNLTIIALRVLATSQLNNVLDSLNYVATSSLSVYDSDYSVFDSWSKITETRNPADMLRYALKGRAAQQIVDDEDIDYPALEKYYTWCNEHNYTCDAYLSESVTIAELLQMIGSTSRADILRIDSKISVVQDIERPTHRQLFTPKNTKSYSITMFSADIPDAIALRYIDSESGYAQNECTVYNTPDGNKIAEPETTQKVDLWGITNSEQARRIGMYNYGCIKQRPFVHTIDVDIEYLLCNKGDWIQYAGDIALAGSIQGRIKKITKDSDGRCLGFTADEPIEMDADKTYAVRIRTADGIVILQDIWTNTEAATEVEFINPLAKGTLPKSGDLYAFGIRGMEVTDLIITDIQPGQDLSATLTCVEYSPPIFKVDEPDFILPDFENKITPVSGAIDSGTVSQDNWKFFITYHDGEEEPGRPTGSGEDNGWHHAQTQQSVWQSSKTAESLSSGIWSPPIRNKGEDGKDGISITDYYLQSSAKIIKIMADGSISPNKISCQQFLITGNSSPVESNLFLKYVIDNGEEKNYEGSITVLNTFKNITFRLYDDLGTLLDFEEVPVLSDGAASTIYELLPSASVIKKNQSGIPEPSILKCIQRSKTGESAPVTSNKKLVYVISKSTAENSYSESGIMIDASWEWVEFRLYDGEVLLDAERVGILSDGSPATVYDLLPSTTVIRKLSNETVEPQTITCEQRMTVGNNAPVPSSKKLVYGTSLSPEELNYTGPISVNPAWTWIEFRLKDGDTVLDRQSISVVSDGNSPIIIRLIDDNKSISCDAFGTPLSLPFTTQAFMYQGANIITDENQLPELFKKMTVHFPTSGTDIFSPRIGNFYPVKTTAVEWSIEGPTGVSIDQTGVITVAKNAALKDENEILVKGTFNSNVYTTTLDITKAYAGHGSLAIELQSDSIAIPCDEYGDPKLEAFPILNEAVYHNGTEIIAVPKWSLADAPAGVSINTMGIIRIEHSYDYKDQNEIVVKGLFNGIERIKTLSITKVLDGVAPIVLNINPNSTNIPCDHNGIPKYDELPLTIKASLYKGTTEITDASYLPRITRRQIVLYPSSGASIFSPFALGMYPVSTTAIKWSLADAPVGVTIDEGHINISKIAQLAALNTITVIAEYEEKTYTKVFSVSKTIDGQQGMDGDPGKDGANTERIYLGVVGSAQTTAKITLKNGLQKIAHISDWVLCVPSGSASVWVKNYIYEWNGIQWQQLDPMDSKNTPKYIAVASDMPRESGIKVFAASVIDLLISDDAFITTLAAKTIKLQQGGKIYGGSFLENGTNPTNGEGFHISENSISATGIDITSIDYNGQDNPNRVGYKYAKSGLVVINELDSSKLKLPSMSQAERNRFSSFSIVGGLRGYFSGGWYHDFPKDTPQQLNQASDNYLSAKMTVVNGQDVVSVYFRREEGGEGFAFSQGFAYWIGTYGNKLNGLADCMMGQSVIDNEIVNMVQIVMYKPTGEIVNFPMSTSGSRINLSLFVLG
jgi:hypothetical protein